MHMYISVAFLCFFLKGWGQVITAVVIQRGMMCECEGEDRFNGQKRIGLNEDTGIIYSYSLSFGTACTSFTLQSFFNISLLLCRF